MSAKEIHLREGTCSCLLEDPGQGSLRLDAVALSTMHAVLGESPDLTIGAYVDVTLEFKDGPRAQLFAQIVTHPAAADDDEDGALAAPEYVLRWIHSDPLGETKLSSMIEKYIECGGRFSRTESRAPAKAVSPLLGDDTAGILIVPDQFAPAPAASSRSSSDPSRRSFKFSHLVQGDGSSPNEAARPGKEFTVRPPPRGRHAAEPGQDEHDMGTLLRQRAKMVSASELAARHDRVRVLGESTLRQLLDEAVNEAVEKVETSLGEAERKQLLEEAEEAFHERLEAFKAEKAGLESRARVLADQLERAQKLLEEERQRVVTADQFTVSDAGMVEIETRLERMLQRAVRSHGIDAKLEGEMRDVLSRLLDEERDRISTKHQETQNANIELLERKIERLAHTLDETTKERDRERQRAAALEAAGGGGLRNVMTVGLDDDDPNKERKLGLLKEIYRQNKEMRDSLSKSQTAGDAPSARPESHAASPPDTSETEETQLIAQAATAVAHGSENLEST